MSVPQSDMLAERAVSLSGLHKNKMVTELSEELHIMINSSRRSLVLAVGIFKQFLPFRNCFGEDCLLAEN